ncbi:S1C family serine protease [Variovorax sp. KBW07]|uniref:S1C family serine protease n=1 Tax=Variovorax sp. KBW07 TaxID=2153358 RepID=UPI00162AEBC7|nr:serine protease [Variovorax sp. KBW07]
MKSLPPLRGVSMCLAPLAFLGLALAAGPAAALEPEALFSKVSGSVWSVRTFDAQERPLRAGSAVVIAPGRLVTNCHVLAKASSFVIKQDNVTYGATLEFPDPARDLCQIKVANFTAPPVALAPAGSARVGQRVYAIGNPRGLENTLSEGILSGLRGGGSGGAGGESEARLLQTTAAISAGSSGGGLFDSEGRLLGITSFAARDGGSLNFAMPVEFLSELPTRAKAVLEARASEPADSVRRRAGGAALTEPLRPGDALEYVRTDRLTGTRSTVLYRVDRVNGDEIVFNGGGKVEKTDGQVVSVTSPAGGLFDSSSPPGGWARANLLPGMRWQADYTAAAENQRYELIATVGGERSVRVDGVELQVLRIGYEGWIYASSLSAPLASGSSRFTGAALYSPELRRVVRFEASYQRGIISGGNEVLELVRIQR